MTLLRGEVPTWALADEGYGYGYGDGDGDGYDAREDIEPGGLHAGGIAP